MTYKNIPVDEETYQQVRMISEANGFGKRGLGAQVRKWAAREIAAPVCEHPKQPVEVQTFPTADQLSGAMVVQNGWFCPTCNRVYPRDMLKETVEVTERVVVNTQDPYVPNVKLVTKKKKGG